MTHSGTNDKSQLDTGSLKSSAEVTATIRAVSGPLIRDPEHLRRYLQQFLQRRALRIGEFLVSTGQVEQASVDAALTHQQQNPGRKLGEILVAAGAINVESVRNAVYTLMGVPSIALEAFPSDSNLRGVLPLTLIRRLRVIPIMRVENRLVLACDKVPGVEEIAEIEFAARNAVHFVLASHAMLNEVLFRQFELTETGNDNGAPEIELPSATLMLDEEVMANRPPVIRLVNSLLQDAIEQRASDIHIHPERDDLSIVYRIDGSLVAIQRLQRSMLASLISRLKIMASLNIAEHRLPQDGRIQVTQGQQRVDMRLSIIPFVWGEGAVIRLLNKQQGLRSVDQIGLDTRDQVTLQNILARGTGMLLVTGPTGSGKTTTLYAALQEIAKQKTHIVTVEDPVEYELPGMHQIQLLEALNFSFAQTLRHILRHDPDVIMIGEIRDVDTAKIAMESALTGHLVLSTLHTNDAPGAIIRLKEMGLSSYLIRSTISGVLAQRLVRLNCPHCRVVEEVNEGLRERFHLPKSQPLLRGNGCTECRHTGFSGRRAIYELFELSDAIQAHVDESMSAQQWRELALSSGMRSMMAHGMQFVAAGDLSFMELYGACY